MIPNVATEQEAQFRALLHDGQRLVEVIDVIDGEGIKVKNCSTEFIFAITFDELSGWQAVKPASNEETEAWLRERALT